MKTKIINNKTTLALLAAVIVFLAVSMLFIGSPKTASASVADGNYIDRDATSITLEDWDKNAQRQHSVILRTRFVIKTSSFGKSAMIHICDSNGGVIPPMISSPTIEENYGVNLQEPPGYSDRFELGKSYRIRIFLTLSDAGGKEISSDMFETIFTYAAPKELPPNPVKEGHTFTGWFYDTACTQPYDSKPIFEGTPLYAGWQIHRHTVTFYSIPSLAVPTQTVDWGTLITKPAEPKRQGYNFKGWYTDVACTIPYEFNTPVKKDFTLYADWEQIIVTVTFYVDGSVYVAVDVPWGSTLIEAVTAAQSQSEIMSALYSDINLHNALSVNTVVTSDMKIHAQLSAGVEKEPDFFGGVGNWFCDNWLYFPISAGCVGIGMLMLLIIQKKRGAE